jgi:hypothetical protein
MRHPLYVGSFALDLAFCLMTNVPWLAVLFVVAFLAAYVPKATEESHQRYGDGYAQYTARVAAVVPSLRRRPGDATASAPDRQRFTWQRVLRHREYLTWLGATAVLVVLWVRAS